MTDRPETFGTLWKGWFDDKNPRMNTTALPDSAPLVNAPKNASADLLRQARQKINKGEDRKTVLGQLFNSTRRGPAAIKGPVVPAPGVSNAPGAPTGFGGAGYSGNVASRLGQSSNVGFSSASAPRPSPNPAPASAPPPPPPPPPLPKPV